MSAAINSDCDLFSTARSERKGSEIASRDRISCARRAHKASNLNHFTHKAIIWSFSALAINFIPARRLKDTQWHYTRQSFSCSKFMLLAFQMWTIAADWFFLFSACISNDGDFFSLSFWLRIVDFVCAQVRNKQHFMFVFLLLQIAHKTAKKNAINFTWNW